MFYYDRAKILKIKGLTRIIMPSKKTGLYYALSPLTVIIIAIYIFKFYRELSDYTEASFGYIAYGLLSIVLSIFNIYMIIFFLWTCCGKEIIEYNAKILRIKKTIFGLGYTKEINRSNITAIKFNEQPDKGVLLIIGNGKIKINTMDSSHNVGLGINNKNAREVISMLTRDIPNSN